MKYCYFIFTLLFSVTASFAQTLEDDRLSLIAIYNSTYAGYYGSLGNDPPGTSPCGWKGVTCSGGRVTELHLRDERLSGSIPPEIGNLTALTKLVMLRNSYGSYGIGGSIPSSLWNLTNLEFLDLSGNDFGGQLPPEIGNLTKLKYLNLSYFPFGPSQVYNGRLTGPIPKEIGNLMNLQYLNLYRQNFTGSLPAEIGNLSNLVTLNLAYNKLSGTIPNLSGIPVAATVDVSNNSFNFSGMEGNISRLDSYSPQAKLPLNIIYNTFPLPYIISVDAGGLETGYPTYSNNKTYKFFKDGQLIATQVWDGSRFIEGGGVFKIEVTNSLIPGLTLYSEEVFLERGPMPVTIVSFKGANEQNGNFLTWQTTSETTNKGFEIERSKDAINFENIGFIDGNGDSKATNDYSFLDKNPFTVSYYRLKQIDYDGRFEHSKVIYVKRDNRAISFYPNPAKNQLFVSGLEKEETITIHNLGGRKVVDQKISSSQPVNTSTLSSGLYIIKIGKETGKLVIQN